MPNLKSRFADLRTPEAPGPFEGENRAVIAFPLGGIGTGSISIGGWGQLRDFEIFNRPAKGQMCAMTFFTLQARRAGEDPVARVLQGPLAGSRDFAHGVSLADGAGLPHFAANTFTGQFPFARLDFTDRAMPLRAALEAFNPMIPLEADDSSLPAAIFLVHLHNPSRTKSVRATLFANLQNFAGHPALGRNVTEFAEAGPLRGLRMSTAKHPPESPFFGSMALATTWRQIQIQTRWPRIPRFDQLQLFWDQVLAGRLKERRERVESDDKLTDVGSLGLDVTLRPGASATLPVIIAWHVPNAEKYWQGAHGLAKNEAEPRPLWRNHYATRFDDAWAVAGYMAAHLKRLEGDSRRFAETLYSSTLPAAVLDAAGSQMSILKTTTCLRLEDGSFYGWEGCHPTAGCCEGTCSHVWNYAQAPHFLYPRLQATAVETHLNHCLDPDGAMSFRLPLPLGTDPGERFFPAADGQMGLILAAARYWQFTGDDDWLRRYWPKIRVALEYAWKYWDADRDGVMEGLQHNTYDIEFYGPNTMITSLYLAALRAGAAMARGLGLGVLAESYESLARHGAAKVDAELFFENDYYIQKVDPRAAALSAIPADKAMFFKHRQDDVLRPDEPPYQYGFGCLSDQLIGQWYAHILGFGHILDPGHVRQAMAAIFRHNFRPTLQAHVNTHRVYAVGEEAALLICTWPHGRRETNPFIYAHEVFYGIEYQVAAHLIYEGLVDEGLTIVKAVRDRHNGYHRNPWNEVECGNHYARSMASWSLIVALSGFHYEAPAGRLSFAPRVHRERFRTFFTTGSAWGSYHQELPTAAANFTRRGRASAAGAGGRAKPSQAEVRVEHGKLEVRTLIVEPAARLASPPPVIVTLGSRKIAATATVTARGQLEISLARPQTIRAGTGLKVCW